jgi:hypothetical protein
MGVLEPGENSNLLRHTVYFRPSGSFSCRPGVGQFVIDKLDKVKIR